MAYPTAATMTRSVLQRITAEYYKRINEMVNEDNERLWNNVVNGPIISNNGLVLPICCIWQGPEQTIRDFWPLKEQVVTYYVEFRFGRYENLDSQDVFQYYLGKLQARLFGVPANILLGGLTSNVLETDNHPEIESENDPMPGGMLIFQAYYRHWNGDPYHLPSETPNYAYGSI